MVQQFGNYLLDEEIARGGMARVYRARLRGLGGFEKTLVVKQVRPELANDPRFVRMFVEEAKTLVQMSHPHIVPVYELGVVDGTYFLAMEYVEGATLDAVLRKGPLETALAAHVGVQVCDALAYAHGRFGLVHRDVTPRNVIVDAAGHVRLLDFGIARPADAGESEEIFGSPGYMAPEQARGGAVTEQSDLFALGTVLFEAVTARKAFLRNDPEQTRTALLEQPPPRAADDETVPSEIAALIDQMLQPDPHARPTSASQVAKRLRGWLAARHPEGVAPELGARAEAAFAAGAPSASDPMAAGRDKAPREPSHVVRTLATSPALTAMLEGTGSDGAADAPADEGERHPHDGRAEASPGADASVQPPDDGTMQGTLPLPRAERAAPADPPPSGGEPSHPVQHARSNEDPAPAPASASAQAASPRGRHGRRARGALGFAALALLAVAAVTGTRMLSDPEGARGAVASESSPAASEPSEADPASAPSTPEPSEGSGGSERAEAAVRPPDSGAGAAEPEPTPRPRPGASSSPSRSSPLTVNATPWAEVTLDGRPIGTTPQRGVPVRPGEHELQLRCPPLGRQARVSFEARGGSPVRVLADLTRDPPSVSVR